MLAEPNGAAETAPTGPAGRPSADARAGTRRGGARTATGPTPGPPPPCGMQNVLCRLRWLTSAPNLPGCASAHHRIEVGAVDVHLPAVTMHDLAQLADVCLEHSVRRRVGHHRPRPARSPAAVGLGLEIVEVDVALPRRIATTTTFNAGHHRAGRVGAVRARRDEAHVAAGVAAAAVIGVDGEKAGELALAAGVGLQADRVVARDRRPASLRAGRSSCGTPTVASSGVNGCMSAKLRPGQRLHLDGGVELHRARAQRDHRAIEREVLVGQATQVPQHLVLGVIAGEHALREELVGAAPGQTRRCRCPRSASRSAPASNTPSNVDSDLGRGRFVEAETDGRVVDEPEIEAGAMAARDSTSLASALHLQRVEPRVVDQTRNRRSEGRRPPSTSSRCTRSAIRRSPSGPCHAAYSPAMLASSTCAVQMLDVAFSRRMCCSRVCRARRIAGRPSVSVLTPDQSAGQGAGDGLAGSDERRRAAHRTPSTRRNAAPNRWRCRRRDRAGGTVSTQASRSVATTARPPTRVHRRDRLGPV